MNSTKTLQWSPLQLIVDSTAAIGGVHCSVQWNPRQCFVESTARSECLRYLIVESNALQRNSLQKNRQKSGIDCNVIAFVSGLRCTLSKTAVQRNPLLIFKIPIFGTVMIPTRRKAPTPHRVWQQKAYCHPSQIRSKEARNVRGISFHRQKSQLLVSTKVHAESG